MNSKKLCCICVLFSLLAGCASESSIDEKKKKAQVTQSNINKNTPQQLTDKDLFGNETTLAVSEEDIQAALDGDEFRVPLNSPVILVQSGNRAPETIMQEEMRKYYTVSTFSGIPDRQKPLTCNKNKDKNEKLTDAISLRYLVRFTLVDVATGEWATWSPVNYEYKMLPPLPDKNEASTTDMTEQQIMQLKQKTYKAMVKDLVNRYQ
ncbi:TPA: hypothetical protein ACG2WB_003922 [Escherichia coli]